MGPPDIRNHPVVEVRSHTDIVPSASIGHESRAHLEVRVLRRRLQIVLGRDPYAETGRNNELLG